MRRAAVCAASVRAARANPGEWFCAPSGEGIAVCRMCELLCISGGLKFAYRILGAVRGVLDEEGLYYLFCWIEGVFKVISVAYREIRFPVGRLSALLFFDIIKEGEKRTKSVEADAGLVAQYEGMP